MLIYLVRHGETDANVRGLLQGWTDEPLNENGVHLAEITGRALKGVKFDCCYASPLSRALRTAEIILKETGCDIPVQCDDRLKEINIGYDDSKRAGEGILSAEEAGKFLYDPWNFVGFPGGENIRQVCSRTQSFLKELISNGREGTYLVGTHGCAVRAMLNFLYDNPENFWRGHLPYNCCVNIVEVKEGTATLVGEDIIFYPADLAVDHFRS